MGKYSFLQIVMFFIMYCFLGWIWETFYVSIKEHRFVNRGFLHGPLIPIYGFGAMTILVATLPFKDTLWQVFLFGMLAATVLELVTGTVMEAIFKVRYWDYRRFKTNFKGYISLPTSIVWGAFSIIMVKFIHTPIESFVLSLTQTTTEVVTVILVSVGSMDVAVSVREALDLKEILHHISEFEKVQKAKEVVGDITTNISTDAQFIKDKLTERLEILGKGEFRRIKGLLDRNPSASSAKYENMFETVKTTIKEWKRPATK